LNTRILKLLGVLISTSSLQAFAYSPLESHVSRFNFIDQEKAPTQIVLKNDSFNEQTGQAYLQTGFVAQEKAGVWLKVPNEVKNFKIDYFRVLIGNGNIAADQTKTNLQVFFQMGVTDSTNPQIDAQIENAASVTPGPYWNDIPAVGQDSSIGCAKGGQYVGAALEFTHSGAPSVFRDLDGINAANNVIFAIPGGWNYSAAYGLRGDWVLRVVGHEALPGECD